MPPKAGKLIVVSTPIGNLGDVTQRGVEILNTVALVAVEDTRRSKKLFSHFSITTPMISYFEHNRISRIPELIKHLNKGEDIALITDAGTPGISDPAYRIVRHAIDSSINIESIPGASAVLAGLISSGLPTRPIICLELKSFLA